MLVIVEFVKEGGTRSEFGICDPLCRINLAALGAACATCARYLLATAELVECIALNLTPEILSITSDTLEAH